MSDINPIEYGRLIQSVETLTDELKELAENVSALKEQMTGGKGVIVGMLIASAGIGAGAVEFLKHVFK